MALELPDIFDVRWQDSALCCDGAPGQLFVLPRTLRPDLGHASLRWLLTGSCANGAGMWRKTTRRGGRSCQELGRDSAGNGLRGCVRAWVSDRSASGSGGRRVEPIAAGMVHRQSMTAQRVPLSAH